jgi:hypothetical protein
VVSGTNPRYFTKANALEEQRTYRQRQAEKLKAGAATIPEDQPSDQLRELAGAPSVVVMNVIDGLAWLGWILMMVDEAVQRGTPG